MKKLLTIALVALLAISSCTKSDKLADVTNDETPQITQRNCGAMEVLAQQIAADPTLEKRMNAIEQFTQRYAATVESGRGNTLVGGVITIPVVVNVVYNTAAQNISDAQIQSQIDVLNEDYNNTNADRTKVPSAFSGVDATVGIRFTLAGINRKQSNKKSWSTNDAVKKSSQGGIDPTDPAHNLNMWVCNLGQSLLGYAQFPGGNPATDGVVILYSAFGRTGTLINTYNKGRTATHEVGHWMNLRHIWGDATCGNDMVDDTPVAQTSNYGCPNYPKVSSCGTDGHAEMTMNYMDYTDDACMYMFTNGQKSRILATFAAGGPRAAIAQ
ncbi:MAG: zinc metalloprotease [Chitinophagaceae bacterium]